MIASSSLPRLMHMASDRPLSLNEHETSFSTTARVSDLLGELEASGLTGRGGAGFTTSVKARFIRDQRSMHKFVVVNAMEGEPASHKDQTLVRTHPHLVLEGAESMAAVVGAKNIAVCVARDNRSGINAMERAIHERTRRSLRGPKLDLHTPPQRYVAGEESALTHWLDDNESLPQYRRTRPHVLRIGHAPVLVENAETLANVALIGRFGAEWFRGLGTVSSPGSTLVSVSGATDHPTVLEVELGTPIRTILSYAHADTDPQAILFGGYGGSWISGELLDVPYCNEALSDYGVSVGAGVLVVLPAKACGLSETQRIVQWMANESARQCGPCAFGLPALAEDLLHLVRPTRDAATALGRLRARCDVINGRGACHHPDGVVRLVRSALSVFAQDVERHCRGKACKGTLDTRHYATIPRLERAEELVWE